MIPVGGTVVVLQADASWRGLFCLRNMAPAVWGMTQSRDPGRSSFTSLPGATSPDCPHASLDHSVLPLLEPRVSDCGWNFVCWPFKSLSAFQPSPPWWTETSLLFTVECYLGFFPGPGAIGWGAQLGG